MSAGASLAVQPPGPWPGVAPPPTACAAATACAFVGLAGSPPRRRRSRPSPCGAALRAARDTRGAEAEELLRGLHDARATIASHLALYGDESASDRAALVTHARAIAELEGLVLVEGPGPGAQH